MGHVVVEGVAVPAAIASSFSDPEKRPFSYTEPLPPSAERPRTPQVHVTLPKVLPIFGNKEEDQQQKVETQEMPTVSHLQYNTPLPLYSREAAEEQYKQQVGAVPPVPLGPGTAIPLGPPGPAVPVQADDKHFDPERSETLKAIHAGEDDTFGKTFFEKIAQAEAPRIPIDREPAWTETARRKAERARSATPSSYATHQAPAPYYGQYATIHGTSATNAKKINTVRNKGYEFGGLDYVDKSRIPVGPSYDYYYYHPKPVAREERKKTPGYEMGGQDFGRGNISLQGPYHGHGPEHPRLQPKFDVAHSKHNEMNIETAPNINAVSADILVGDTVSNQKLGKDDGSKDRGTFGTSFAPPGGFRMDHRAVARQEAAKPTTYGLSARKEFIGQGNLGYTPYQENRYRTKVRSFSAAPADRYEQHREEYVGDKEVTIDTLLNDSALYPRKRTETPAWYTYSLDKQRHWKNGLDPRLTRSQIYSYEPNWSRTVRERRNAWESQAENLESRLQRPASEKVPVHQPPHWYSKANQTHDMWQSAADRQASRAQSEFTDEISRYRDQDYGTSYTTEIRRAQDYKSDWSSQPQQYRQDESSLKRELQSYGSQREVPITRNAYSSQTTTTTAPATTWQPYSGQVQKWEPKSTPAASQGYYSSSSQYAKEESKSSYKSSNYQKEESSREQYTSQPRAIRTYETQRTDTSQAAPVSTKQVVTVTEGTGGDFNRVAEMAEVLPRGTVANTQASTKGNYTDADGRAVSYTRELMTTVDPNRECSLLKEEERRVVETPLEPGIISRHITTKYYKKKTVTDTTTTTTTTVPQ